MREVWYSFVVIAFLARSALLFYYSRQVRHRKDDFIYSLWFLTLALSYAFYALTRRFPEGVYAEFVFDGILGAIVIGTSTIEYIKTLKRK